MGQPDPSAQLWQQGGYSDLDWRLSVKSAANIRFGDNPSYSVEDFLAVYPQFETIVPDDVLQMYVTLASASINQLRWLDWWEMAMGLFIAHFCTLYLQASVPTGSSAKLVASAGIAKGLQVSKTAGDVSASYKDVVDDLPRWGAFKLTSFGMQLATLAQIVGFGPMYVW